LVGLSAAAVAVLAYLGLDTWRRELKGKSEYQLAKDVLKAVYKVRDAFRHVRNPVIYSYEFPEAMRDSNGSLKREHDHEGMAHVYEKRFSILNGAFMDLEEKHLEAQVEWGQEFQEIIIPLRECRAELLVTVQSMLERKKTRDRMTPDEASNETSILYHLGKDSKYDKFTPKIEEAVNKFEKWLRPHISRKK
jgi:hypothetical protein